MWDKGFTELWSSWQAAAYLAVSLQQSSLSPSRECVGVCGCVCVCVCVCVWVCVCGCVCVCVCVHLCTCHLRFLKNALQTRWTHLITEDKTIHYSEIQSIQTRQMFYLYDHGSRISPKSSLSSILTR